MKIKPRIFFELTFQDSKIICYSKFLIESVILKNDLNSCDLMGVDSKFHAIFFIRESNHIKT